MTFFVEGSQEFTSAESRSESKQQFWKLINSWTNLLIRLRFRMKKRRFKTDPESTLSTLLGSGDMEIRKTPQIAKYCVIEHFAHLLNNQGSFSRRCSTIRSRELNQIDELSTPWVVFVAPALCGDLNPRFRVGVNREHEWLHIEGIPGIHVRSDNPLDVSDSSMDSAGSLGFREWGSRKSAF